MGGPVQFVAFDEASQRFEVREDALQILRDVQTPVAVISISGRAREGKSFVLNQLLGQSSGFKVGSTQRPCTKGLWLWSKPILRTGPDRQAFHLVLLDTEGVDAYDQTGQYSTQVFCLAVLLSSLFVFNQMGPITESSLNQLSLVAEMTKRVRQRSDQGASAELQSFAPSFIWLLRDFYLELEDGQQEMTTREYLEMVLRPVEGLGDGIEAKNQLRASIKELFPDRDCCMLVRPVSSESDLIRLDSLPVSALRPEFVQGVQNLLNLLNAKTRPKTLGCTLVTGNMLAALTQAYVTAINEGAVPSIATAWMSVAEKETRHAMDLAEQTYEDAFDHSICPDDDVLYAEHQRCLALAQMAFDEEALGDESMKRPYREKLLYVLKKHFDLFREKRRAEAAAHLDSMLVQAATDLANRAHEMNAAELYHHARKFVEKFQKEGSGSAKWEKLCGFVMDHFAVILTQKATHSENEAATAKEAHLKILEDMQKYRAEEDRVRSIEQKYHELQGCHAALVRENHKTRSDLESEKAEHQSAKQENERTATMLQQRQSELSAVAEEHALLSQKLEQGAVEFKSQQEALSRAVHEAEAARLSESSQRRSTESELHRLHGQIAVLERERDQMREGWNQERESTENRIRQGQLHLDQMKAEMESVQRTNVELRRETELLKADLPRASGSTELQLAQTAQALREAQEKVRVLEARLQVNDRPKWQSPPRDSSPHSVPIRPQGGAGTSRSATELERMTIAQLKDWLMHHGHEDVVWNAQKGSAQPRKADWIEFVRQRM